MRGLRLPLGTVLLAAIVLLCVGAPWVAGFDPVEIDPLQRLRPPAATHWFGTDALGRDVFSRAVWGGRTSLAVGAAVAILAIGGGVLVGLAAGCGRWIDAVVMSTADGLMAIPSLLFAIAWVAAARPGLWTVIAALAVPEVPRTARLVRSLLITLREEPYVEAARAAGAELPWILALHVLPHMVPPLIVQGTFIAGAAVLGEATLSFLGAGLPAEVPSWGTMMAEGRSFAALALHVLLFPGLLIAGTLLAIHLIGDGLQEWLDPRR